MGEMVIAAYRPKEGKAEELEALVRDHVPFLRRLGLASDRPAAAMRAKNGEIIEVFEWKEGAVAAAHQHPEVQKLWERFGELCDYIPLAAIEEAQAPFPGFEPIAL
ncbi:MAG: hypothetical protein M3N07_04205 [Pseudomonadota bacterium]|nr:hypothetical protein [Pseudomonadota bacterium]